jgi:hypothetical protein
VLRERQAIVASCRPIQPPRCSASDGTCARRTASSRGGFVPRIADPSFAIETQIYPVTHEPTGWKLDIVLGPGLEQRFLDKFASSVLAVIAFL